MKVAVIQTPGSNCDQDALHALREIGVAADYVWHRASNLSGFDAAVIPGGFTYGDYLRGGAIAAQSSVFAEVRRFATEGKPVLGICNGFQILTECGILPGALVRNEKRRFLCRNVYLKAVNTNTEWTRKCTQPIQVPIAHNEGRYIADDEDVSRLEGEDRIAFVYCTPDGEAAPAAAPNGSTHNIAGILNEKGNVLGLMPHPERAVDDLLGGSDGRLILERLLG